ncbi:hypothetical protein [Bradyrhizobium sp. S3.2.12]|uniref:hypothetical protein n=1 Tax=Bradyrhizobium sp. S3.2.12 TaxID=3156387 RepID=UPI0033979EF2
MYGYALKPVPARNGCTDDKSGRLEIGPGLALDECGRELLQTRPTLLGVEDVILLNGKSARIERPPDGSFEPRAPQTQKQTPQPIEACWLLSAHYAEQSEGPIRVNDPCSCERHEWDRVCETVRYSLRRVDCAQCCDTFDCELECGCCTGPCCEPHAKDPVKDPGAPGASTNADKSQTNPVHRGGCGCLCEHLTGLSDSDCGGLCPIEDPCAHIRADLRHGVPLACVTLREGDCDNWVFDIRIEACGPRRLVKRNDALFDLIRGCDLTRISAIGWADWHRSETLIEWGKFLASFGTETAPKSGRNLTVKYWVEFSRPVRDDTLRADCFSMTVVVNEEEAGWGVPRRVPIQDIVKSATPGTPTGFVTRATLVVDAGWVDDALESRKTIFNHDTAAVEIEVRGDFIVDCNGQTIDANAIGLSPAPTGNGTPGGTFYSSFHVQARDSQSPPPA